MPERDPLTTSIARKLRQNQTDAEKLLWSKLRSRQLEGAKFRRQFPLPPYVADFCCEEAQLIVEVDGSQHMESVEADQERTTFFEQEGSVGGDDAVAGGEHVVGVFRVAGKAEDVAALLVDAFEERIGFEDEKELVVFEIQKGLGECDADLGIVGGAEELVL